MVRAFYDGAFDALHPLRKLAKNIATISCANATSDCFYDPTKSDQPLNFLANGMTAGYPLWPPVLPPTGSALAKWKFSSTPSISKCEEYGYSLSTPSEIGLALLFDPLVDAALFWLALAGKPVNCDTLIVLSDYYPLAPAFGGLSALPPNYDWAMQATVDLLCGKFIDPTTRNLFNCVLGGAKILGHVSGIVPVVFASKRILIWNFLPMFRGGSTPSGSSGLPARTATSGHNPNWQQGCFTFLEAFCEAVKPEKVVFCVSDDMVKLPSNGSKPIHFTPTECTLYRIGNYISDLDRRHRVFSLDHPSAWHYKSFADAKALSDIFNL